MQQLHSTGARCAATVLLGLSLGLGASYAFAAGDDGGANVPICKKGEIWNAVQKKCVSAKSGALPDSEVTDYAYALAKAERYDEALQMLDMLDNPRTAKALNYRGYATRKLGRTEEGISYYLQSVALDPHYAQVREYLGEAYVIQGKPELAKEQLRIIETICGTGCEEYEDLAEAIKTPGSL